MASEKQRTMMRMLVSLRVVVQFKFDPHRGSPVPLIQKEISARLGLKPAGVIAPGQKLGDGFEAVM